MLYDNQRTQCHKCTAIRVPFAGISLVDVGAGVGVLVLPHQRESALAAAAERHAQRAACSIYHQRLARVASGMGD